MAFCTTITLFSKNSPLPVPNLVEIRDLHFAYGDRPILSGLDMDFPRHLPTLFPAYDAKGFFDNTPTAVQPTAFRNASLQGGYLIMAARALGLDCGPMSGFDAGKLDQAFWAGTAVQSNFICTLGKGDPAKLFPRNPRLAFEEACQLA